MEPKIPVQSTTDTPPDATPQPNIFQTSAGLTGSELASQEERRTRNKKTLIFALLALSGLVLVVGVLAFIKSRQSNLKAESTDCFSISVPTTYQTYGTSNACQFVAYKGQKNSPDAQILVTSVLTGKPSTVAEAKLQLQTQNPNMTIKEVQVGGYDAVMQEGISSGGGHEDRLVRTYVVILPKTYPGAHGQIRAFFVNLIVPVNGHSLADSVTQSIVWK